MSAVPDAVSGLETALGNANRLLTVDPRLADEQAAEILKVVPNQPNAMMLQALAKGRLQQWPEAVDLLRRLSVLQPKWPAAFMELGFALRQAGFGDQAVIALKRSVFLKPDVPKAWLALADLHAAMGDAGAADTAYAMQLKYAAANPHLMAAAGAMAENNLAVAERALKNYLKR